MSEMAGYRQAAGDDAPSPVAEGIVRAPHGGPFPDDGVIDLTGAARARSRGSVVAGHGAGQDDVYRIYLANEDGGVLAVTVPAYEQTLLGLPLRRRDGEVWRRGPYDAALAVLATWGAEGWRFVLATRGSLVMLTAAMFERQRVMRARLAATGNQR